VNYYKINVVNGKIVIEQYAEPFIDLAKLSLTNILNSPPALMYALRSALRLGDSRAAIMNLIGLTTSVAANELRAMMYLANPAANARFLNLNDMSATAEINQLLANPADLTLAFLNYIKANAPLSDLEITAQTQGMSPEMAQAIQSFNNRVRLYNNMQEVNAIQGLNDIQLASYANVISLLSQTFKSMMQESMQGLSQLQMDQQLYDTIQAWVNQNLEAPVSAIPEVEPNVRSEPDRKTVHINGELSKPIADALGQSEEQLFDDVEKAVDPKMDEDVECQDTEQSGTCTLPFANFAKQRDLRGHVVDAMQKKKIEAELRGLLFKNGFTKNQEDLFVAAWEQNLILPATLQDPGLIKNDVKFWQDIILKIETLGNVPVLKAAYAVAVLQADFTTSESLDQLMKMQATLMRKFGRRLTDAEMVEIMKEFIPTYDDKQLNDFRNIFLQDKKMNELPVVMNDMRNRFPGFTEIYLARDANVMLRAGYQMNPTIDVMSLIITRLSLRHWWYNAYVVTPMQEASSAQGNADYARWYADYKQRFENDFASESDFREEVEQLYNDYIKPMLEKAGAFETNKVLFIDSCCKTIPPFLQAIIEHYNPGMQVEIYFWRSTFTDPKVSFLSLQASGTSPDAVEAMLEYVVVDDEGTFSNPRYVTMYNHLQRIQEDLLLNNFLQPGRPELPIIPIPDVGPNVQSQPDGQTVYIDGELSEPIADTLGQEETQLFEDLETKIDPKMDETVECQDIPDSGTCSIPIPNTAKQNELRDHVVDEMQNLKDEAELRQRLANSGYTQDQADLFVAANNQNLILEIFVLNPETILDDQSFWTQTLAQLDVSGNYPLFRQAYTTLVTANKDLSTPEKLDAFLRAQALLSRSYGRVLTDEQIAGILNPIYPGGFGVATLQAFRKAYLKRDFKHYELPDVINQIRSKYPGYAHMYLARDANIMLRAAYEIDPSLNARSFLISRATLGEGFYFEWVQRQVTEIMGEETPDYYKFYADYKQRFETDFANKPEFRSVVEDLYNNYLKAELEKAGVFESKKVVFIDACCKSFPPFLSAIVQHYNPDIDVEAYFWMSDFADPSIHYDQLIEGLDAEKVEGLLEYVKVDPTAPLTEPEYTLIQDHQIILVQDLILHNYITEQTAEIPAVDPNVISQPDGRTVHINGELSEPVAAALGQTETQLFSKLEMNIDPKMAETVECQETPNSGTCSIPIPDTGKQDELRDHVVDEMTKYREEARIRRQLYSQEYAKSFVDVFVAAKDQNLILDLDKVLEDPDTYFTQTEFWLGIIDKIDVRNNFNLLVSSYSVLVSQSSLTTSESI
jgi:hypothetical protein